MIAIMTEIGTVIVTVIVIVIAEFIAMEIVTIADLTGMTIIAAMIVMTDGATVMIGAMNGRCTGTATAGFTNHPAY